MYLANATVYIRVPFAGLANPADVVEMKLRMKYDDGFAAFLNGMPVASANAPGTLAWNSIATSSHSDEYAQIFTDYDITAFTSSLSTNANLLAIHGLNMAVNSSDLLILPQLEIRTVETNSMASIGFLKMATPGTPNPNAACGGVVEDTNFSVGRGFYTDAFTETIICTEPGATLIHTLDGSEPSLTNGVVTLPPDASTAPTTTVSIVTTTTLRARAVKEGHLPTNIDTQTYLFPLDVIHQTGAGYPLPPHPHKSEWDYEMDPDIVNDPRFPTLNGDITDPAVYASVRAQLDVDGFADYLLMNFYGGNNDWPHNNWYVMRHRPSNGPFTFVAWDVEHYIFLKNDIGPINTSTANSPGIIWARLRLNPEFLLYFADRVHTHMFNSGALTPEKCAARFMGIVDTVLAGMNGEAARWGDTHGEPPYNTADHYNTVVADKINNYFPIRASVVVNALRAQGYYPGIDAPAFSPHGGQVPVHYPLTITDLPTPSPTRSPVLQGWTESGTGAGVGLGRIRGESRTRRDDHPRRRFRHHRSHDSLRGISIVVGV